MPFHVVCKHRARWIVHSQTQSADLSHRQVVDVVIHTGYLCWLQLMFATQVLDYVLLAADSRINSGQVLALGKPDRAFVVFASDNCRVRKLALAAPQTIAQHVRAHRIHFGEAARRCVAFAACIENSVPVKDDGTTLSEFLYQFLGRRNEVAACGGKFLDQSWLDQLHNVLNV